MADAFSSVADRKLVVPAINPMAGSKGQKFVDTCSRHDLIHGCPTVCMAN
jgi:hypothetical protein